MCPRKRPCPACLGRFVLGGRLPKQQGTEYGCPLPFWAIGPDSMGPVPLFAAGTGVQNHVRPTGLSLPATRGAVLSACSRPQLQTGKEPMAERAVESCGFPHRRVHAWAWGFALNINSLSRQQARLACGLGHPSTGSTLNRSSIAPAGLGRTDGVCHSQVSCWWRRLISAREASKGLS